MAEETPPPEEPAAPEVPPAGPPADPGPHGRAKWKVRIAVTLFVLVLVAITGEGLSRIFVKREAPLWLEHPLCWRVLAPDVKVRRGTGAKAVDFETNHFGFRGKSVVSEKRPADVYRIVFMGDDATLSPEVAEGATFPGLVETTLHKH